MSIILTLQTDPPVRYPSLFPKTDSKDFQGLMFGDNVARLESGTGLDLGPLRYAAVDTDPASEAMIREDWGDEAEDMIAMYREQSELAWHSPDAFIACLEKLADWLERHGRTLPEPVIRTLNFSDLYREYIEEGVFFDDVSGCLAAIRAAKEQGARRVRFLAF